MLLQTYTGGRPAEFVHSSKGKASEDPLGEREETTKSAHPRKTAHRDYDDDSDADDNPGSDEDVLFDSEDGNSELRATIKGG